MGPGQSVRETVRRLKPLIRQDAPFDERVQDVVHVGNQYLGANRGYLSRVDEQTDQLTVLASSESTDQDLSATPETERLDPYCRRILNENSLVAVHDISQTEAHKNTSDMVEGGCYIGAPIIVENEQYGTLIFVEEEPRRTPFSDAEILFVTLTAQILERELIREHFDSELTRETNRAAVLNRVLRHNLRNNMSVIRGHAQLMAGKIEDDRLSATTLRNIDQLLELSQKARELDLIIATESEYETTDVAALVERTAETVGESYPDAEIELYTDGPVTTEVMPSFERALKELLENAAKHCGDSPTVTVAVEETKDTMSVRITDTGPGLPDREADVLSDGEEVPLSHGTGLGLWTAYWVVTSHGGTIEPTVTDAGTSLTVTVPRSADSVGEDGMTNLIQARDQYEAAFEEAPDAMVFLNDEARILDANSEATSLLGLPRRELLGRSIRKFHQGPEQFDDIWSEIMNSEKSRDTIAVENEEGNRYTLEYASKADFIPGQHVVINRVIESESNI